MLRGLLAGEEITAGRLHGATLVKRMGIEVLYRKPKTSKPAPGHKVYPNLLRNLAITRPNQVWAVDSSRHLRASGAVPVVTGLRFRSCLIGHDCWRRTDCNGQAT